MKRHASMLAFAPADNLGPANWARLCFEPWEEAWEPAENPCGHIKSLRTKSSRLEWDSRHCCCREVTKSATAPLCSAEKVHVGFGSLFKWGRNKQVGLQISSCKAGGKILCTFKRGQIFVLFWVCFFSSCFTKVLQLENFFFFFFQSCTSSIQHLARDLFGGHLQEKKRDSRRSKWSSIDTAGPASLFSALLFGSQYLSLPAGLRKSHYRRTEELGNYWSKSQTHLEHLVISCEKDGREGACERTCASMWGRRRAREWGDTFRQVLLHLFLLFPFY